MTFIGGIFVGLLADFQARLSIFYTDYKRKGNNYMVPDVDKNMLENAIKELEQVINELT